uniref:HSF-type DNA-binding domain-containing protein n=1 Tax=Pygocentrus nattereri TaxID=42514 RepID=A0A3B4CHV1_PYGNA
LTYICSISAHSCLITRSDRLIDLCSKMTNTMKRKASEGIDDQILAQMFLIKRTRTNGNEVNFSTLTFPQKLWHIVGNKTYKSIRWHQWGTSIIIDVELFSAEILSRQGELKIFDTSVMKSFMRQLNLYGFKKIRSSEGRLERITWMYYNGYFRREHPELLIHVKRRLQVKAKRNSVSKSMTLACTSQSQSPQSGLIEEETPNTSKTSLDFGFSQEAISDAPPVTSSVDSSLDSTLQSLVAKMTDLAQTTRTDLYLNAAQLQSTLAALIPSMSPSVLADLSSLVSRALAQPCPKCGHNPLCSEDSGKVSHQ